MKHQITFLFLISITSMLIGCGSLFPTLSHLEKVDMEIPAAPDVHGANGEQQNFFAMRGNANIAITKKDRVHAGNLKNTRKTCEYKECKSDTLLGKSDYINTTYISSSLYGNGGFDFLFKKNLVLFGLGLQYNHGIYTSFSAGVNTKHFEVGVLGGLWILKRSADFYWTQYTCYNGDTKFTEFQPESEHYDYIATATYGMYASLYNGPFFVSYSLNIYRPEYQGISGSFDENDNEIDRVEGWDIEYPLVLTHHINVGYKFNKFLEYHIGVTRINGKFESPNPELNTGISLYML